MNRRSILGRTVVRTRRAGEVQPSEPAVSGTMSRMDLGRQGSRNGYGMLQPPTTHHRLRGLLVVLLMGAVVLLVLASVGRPLLRTLAVDLAQANPQTLRVSIVADLVREQLGSQLTDPAGQDASPVQFVVPAGANAADIANQLAGQQLLTEPLAFEFVAITSGESGSIQAGTYYLNQAMTPTQLLAALQDPVPVNPYITMALRSGLRIEQITAYLETLPLQKDVAKDFYDLAGKPTDALRADYPFLAALPAGRSLEGFLGWGTFSLKPDATGEGIVRLLLTTWATQVGQAVVNQATTQGAAFYHTLTLASIVDKEVAVESERPAGRRRVCEPSQPQGLVHWAAQRRPHGLLRQRHDAARCAAVRPVAAVLVLEPGHDRQREAAAGPGELPDVRQSGPPRRPHLLADPDRHPGRRSARHGRPATSSSWPRTTAATPTRSPRPTPSSRSC